MAKENENKGGFFRILKQFVTGEESAPSEQKKSVPETEAELEELMAKISPESMQKARNQAKTNTPVTPPPVEKAEEKPMTEEGPSDPELQTAEVAHLLQYVSKMDQPGPKFAYFEFLMAKDGAGTIDPGTEKIVFRTILSSLSAVPDLKGISPDLLVADAERQLRLLMEYAGKRQLEIETQNKGASNKRLEQIRSFNTEIAARRKAIESLQKEITAFEEKVRQAENDEANSARDGIHRLNAARRASEQVSTKIEKDILDIRRYLLPPPTQS